MKWLKRIALVLLVVVVVVLVVGSLFLGSIVKKSVETIGPTVVGAPMKLESAQIRPLRGLVLLRGFTLGNPEGYQTEKAISVRKILVDVNVKSLLSDTIIINRIYVAAPDITYEMALGNSNIGKILDNISGKKKTATEEKKEPSAKEAGKKVVINDFLIEDGIVRVSAKLTVGLAAPIPLPTIHMTDIGKESGGASPADVLEKIFGAIFGGIGKAVTGSAALVGEGAKDVVGGVSSGATSLLGGVKHLFGSDKKSQ